MIKWRELTGGASSFNSTSLSELSRRSQNVIVTQSRGEVKYESVESPKLEKDCRGGSAVLDAPFIWIFEHCLARPKWHEGGRNKKREMDAYRRPPRFKCSLTRIWLKDVLINIGRKRKTAKSNSSLRFGRQISDCFVCCWRFSISIVVWGNCTKREESWWVYHKGKRKALDHHERWRQGSKTSGHKATTQTGNRRRKEATEPPLVMLNWFDFIAFLLQIKKGKPWILLRVRETTEASTCFAIWTFLFLRISETTSVV